MSVSKGDVDGLLADIEAFSVATGLALRPYQIECARAITDSVLFRKGKIFTVMFARQMGKNELSAQLEAYLLTAFAGRGGTLIKAAPTFRPQLITSLLRLVTTLERAPLTAGRWRRSFGSMVQVGRCSVSFLSASDRANVVGATASLLLEIDESQDVDPDKYERDFRPMASSTNATTVLYGTAWNEDSILERQRRINLEHERRTGERLHFEYDWTALAAINPAYDTFVRAEIDRLGLDHPSIQTQYLLHCLSDAGRMFSEEQLRRLAGSHTRQRAPADGSIYVAGIDIAGEDENAEDALVRALVPKRDSTVVTIARVERDAGGNAMARVVEHVWWTGRDPKRQYDDLVELFDRWRFSRAVVDASGIGNATASFLHARYGERVEELVFSQVSKSRLGFGLLAMANTDRIALYADEGNPALIQCWQELRRCRYWLRANEMMAWGVPPAEGHDDFVISLALCAHAASTSLPPALSSLIRPPPPEQDDGW